MAFEELRPAESQDSNGEIVLWWVWKDHLREALLGYYLGEYEVSTRTGRSKVILVYDDTREVYFQAYTPKKYDFSVIEKGTRVRITYTAPQVWKVEIDREDIERDIPVPEEFSDEKDKEERELEALKSSINKQIKSKKHKKDEDDIEGIDF